MVKLKEIQNMFWGVTLDGGKRYTQTVERSFHISMAALESSADPAKPSEKHVSVMIQHEKAEFVMCTLEYGRLFQQPLDLNFTEGEEVTFFLNGTGIVHLTGYLMEEGQYDDEMQLSDMSEEDSDEEEAPELLQMESMDDEDDSEDEDYGKDTSKKKGVKKRKGKDVVAVKVKKAKVVTKADESDDDDEEDSDDDDSDEEFDMQKLLEGEDLDDEDDSDDEEEEQDEDDEEDDQEVPVKSHKNKKQEVKIKEEPKTPIKKEKTESASQNKTPGQNGIATTPGSEERKKKKKKKKKNKNKEGQETPNSTEQSPPSRSGTDTPKKRVYAGGVIVEDIKIGHGPEAKSGKQVQMYYVGTLAQNGKQFDSLKGGKPFKFRLGKGEVIRGWDIGVNGMKVGGKRKLTIPPAMGYGKAKQGLIPPNSTLQFEVELKSVS